ncbi:divalent-cation tolerance protein CutA [candidate division WOR-3 bacterium]|nr:divalent-cation tolerance protein CutA [candidate division WOR-3 bacterium]
METPIKTSFIVVYTTFPNLKTAKRIIKGLIKNRMVACGNIFKLSSIYIWKGEIEQNPEYGVFIKTTKRNYKKVEIYIKNNHPYEVPEIISWEIDKGLNSYLKWIDTET